MVKNVSKQPSLLLALPALSAPAALVLLLSGWVLQLLFTRLGAARMNHSVLSLALLLVVAGAGTAATLFAIRLRGLRTDPQVAQTTLATGLAADAILFVLLQATSRVFPGDAAMAPLIVLFFATYGALGISCCVGLPCLIAPRPQPRTGRQIAGFVLWCLAGSAAGGALAVWQGGNVLNSGVQFFTHLYGTVFAWGSAAGAWRAVRHDPEPETRPRAG